MRGALEPQGKVVKTLVTLIVLLWSVCAGADNTIRWSNLASIDQETIRLKAKEYIQNAMPEIKNAEIKLVDISASYHFRQEHSNLHVMFMHSMSFIEGESEEQIVYIDDKPQVIKMNKIQYIFIDFQRDGEPTRHRIDKVPYSGSKQEFLEEFSRF